MRVDLPDADATTRLANLRGGPAREFLTVTVRRALGESTDDAIAALAAADPLSARARELIE